MLSKEQLDHVLDRECEGAVADQDMSVPGSSSGSGMTMRK